MCVDRNRNRIGAFCLITLAFLVCISCTKPIKSAPEATVVQVSKIESQGFQPVLSLEGELEAISRHELSFLVPGKLISLLVKEGDKVKKGQLLASLESSDYQEALAIAEAKLAEANDQYQRLSNMYASGSLPEADLNKIKSLRNEAEANYNLYKNKKSYTELKAALNGSISKIWARQGMTVDQGQPVLTLLNTDELVAKVGVPEKSIDFIQVGEEAMILIPSLGDTLMGKVNLINPAASRLTRTFEVEVTLPFPE
ncbi:efflux RND transporter periplasmic adaptor subunit [Algoriphagus halophilus]|uniref:efflux RND transporter periplasmic adaptor subunit n=1 Tax=Algoriphagus halophilus TaxID=226505 RepID=UPI00358FBC87